MQLFPVITTLPSVSTLSTTASAKSTEPPDGLDQVQNGSQSVAAEIISRRNSQIASQLAEGPARGVRKMSDNEGEKFFLDYWDFAGSLSALSERELSANVNLTMVDTESKNGYSPARFVAQSYPFGQSFPPVFEEGLQARNFKCPTGTSACTSIGRSDRCCGSGETCEIVADTGHGNVGCCASWQTCSGMIGSCANGYTACSQALGGGCCIPGYDCVEGGCAYITVITVTLHSSVVLSTVTYTSIPQTSASSTTSSKTTSQSSSTTTNDSLTPPARPTNLSTATSVTQGDDICPTGFYACSAVYHGGCCRTGRNCDTTSCPVTSSTTIISDGVTIVAPVATTTGGSTGNHCAKGWFHCADTVGGGCCPQGYACGSSCTATDTASQTTVSKEQATSGGGMDLRVNNMLLVSLMCLWIL